MALQIDGATVGEVRYARPDGTLAPIGEARVWQNGGWVTVYTSWKPRTVTVSTTTTGWNASSDSGDTSLISSLGSTALYLEEDAICDTNVRTPASAISAGNRISAETRIQPSTPMRFGQVYTFTSVR